MNNEVFYRRLKNGITVIVLNAAPVVGYGMMQRKIIYGKIELAIIKGDKAIKR